MTIRRLLKRLDIATPERLAWLLLVVWLGYSGGALAWLHWQDPSAAYCTVPRK